MLDLLNLLTLLVHDLKSSEREMLILIHHVQFVGQLRLLKHVILQRHMHVGRSSLRLVYQILVI